MLRYRIVSGLLLTGILLLALIYLPMAVLWIPLVTISVLGQIEFYRLINLAGIPVFRVFGIAAGSTLLAATWWSFGPDSTDAARAYHLEQLVLMASLILIFVRQFPQRHNQQPITTIATTLFGVWYVPFLLNYVTRLLLAWEGGDAWATMNRTGCLFVMYMVVVVKCNDIGAYFAGRLAGRHKMFQRISPNKTWEGFVGGILLAVFASWVFCHLAHGRLGIVGLPVKHALILGVVLGVVGDAGDLFESLVKRASGAKDSSSTIPGMGGILDVIDSLLFGAPALYVYARMFLWP